MELKNQLNRRNFLRYSGIILSTGGFLASCTDRASDPAPDLTLITPLVTLPAEPVTVQNISCWGDSLTAGAGGKPYATILKEAMPDRAFNYYAISGQQAHQIAARQGGQKIEVTLEGDSFNGDKAVKIIAINNKFLSTGSNQNMYVSKGKVAGVACEITRIVDISSGSKIEVYTIKPLGATTVAVPDKSVFVPDESEITKFDTQILWLGRNDTPRFEQNRVTDIIQSCIDHIEKPARFAIIGILNGIEEKIGNENYDAITAINKLLADKYPDNFIPSTPPTEEEVKAINYTLTEQDKTDINNGTFPKGMFNDNIHFNNRGYYIIAKRVEAFLKRNPIY